MSNSTNLWRAALCLLLASTTISGSSFAATGAEGIEVTENPMAWRISGTVTDANGEPLPGVSVILKGSTPPVGASTDLNGRYNLSVPENPGTLIFSFIGYVRQERAFSGPGEVNATLQEDVKSLQEVVVTGYTTQNRQDITGAVSVVRSEELLQTPAANVQQQLQGRVAGVTTSGGGAPGAGAKVRVRGFGSLGNNDPLYIVDGMPTQNVDHINPNDIESMQVLKDASSASIYGARAANGVIIITTKRGGAGPARISLDSYYGVQMAPRGPRLLNTEEYGRLLWESAINAGQDPGNAQYGFGEQPRIPDYIRAGGNSGVMEGHPDTDPSLYNIDYNQPRHQITRANKEGTDWWNEVFDPATIQSHNLSATGGTEHGQYAVGFNVFDQEGIAKHTRYTRYTARANTQFTAKERFRIGENMQISIDQSNGLPGADGQAAGGGESAILDIYRNQPIIPVYDIMGNFAGTAGTNLGNANNPVADLYRARHNNNNSVRLFGNAFAELDILKNLTARTSFGLDYTTRNQQIFRARTYERSENINTNEFREQNDWDMAWTWSNTLVYQQKFNEIHNLTALIGTEAVKETGRSLWGTRLGLFSEDPDFRVLDRGLPEGQINFSSAYVSTLASVFGRIDYSLRDKYLLNATVRRDGSSRFGQESRYGIFPAASVGWRLSEEGFLQNVTAVNDLKVRVGWGKMGNQLNVDRENAYSFYRSTPHNSGYDIGGTNTGVAQGFDMSRIGNPVTRWEASVTTNIGIDAVLFNNKLEIALDVYNRDTDGLLLRAQAPGTLGNATLPFVNIGDIRNRGFDLMIVNKGNIGASGFRYEAGLTVGHYRNTVLAVGESDDEFVLGAGTRFGPVTRTQAGQPLGSFYGFQIDGFYNNEAELAAGPDQPQKRVGGWRMADLNDDGVINADDMDFIGSPHPDFTAGLNIVLAYRNVDFTMFLYGVYGNQIYNYSKWWTDFNAFQGNRSERMLYDSWRPDNMNAQLPRLDASDTYSNSISHDYYVEDGSYLRARTMQLGYTVPRATGERFGIANLRFYVQAQNLFTITRYTGVDPDVTIQGSETAMGIDGGWYPTPKQYLVGLSLGF